MNVNRAKAIALVLKSEGGRVDDPRDPGGRTNEGITQAVYTAYLKTGHRLDDDVYDITAADVNAIYAQQYMDPIKFDLLPSGVDYTVFDCAVNSGPSMAVRLLQKVLKVTCDGHLGVITLAAVMKADAGLLVGDFCAARLSFLEALSTWPAFGKGWEARVTSVHQVAILMVAQPILSNPIAFPPTPAPAPVPQMPRPRTFGEWLRSIF